jgi:hypothetical protein
MYGLGAARGLWCDAGTIRVGARDATTIVALASMDEVPVLGAPHVLDQQHVAHARALKEEG